MQLASAPTLHAKPSDGRRRHRPGVRVGGSEKLRGGGPGMHVPPALHETGRVRMPEPHETLHEPARHSEYARAHARVPHERRLRHRPLRALACGRGERTPFAREPGVSGARGDEARLVGARDELPSATIVSGERVGRRVHAVERAHLSCHAKSRMLAANGWERVHVSTTGSV